MLSPEPPQPQLVSGRAAASPDEQQEALQPPNPATEKRLSGVPETVIITLLLPLAGSLQEGGGGQMSVSGARVGGQSREAFIGHIYRRLQAANAGGGEEDQLHTGLQATWSKYG